MRKQPAPRVISEADIALTRVIKELKELRERVESLEREAFPFGQVATFPSPKDVRLGRKPRLETEELLTRRMRLTTWLEQNWPRLSIAMRKAEHSNNPSVAIVELIAAKRDGISGVFQPPFYDSPENFIDALGGFLTSGRFHGNPRTLAAAMAGLPEMSWKRSFDICSAHPYTTGHALQAYRDYMKRKFPDRLKELDKVRTEEGVRMVLARSRTHDPLFLHLKENPGKVKEWLEFGKP